MLSSWRKGILEKTMSHESFLESTADVRLSTTNQNRATLAHKRSPAKKREQDQMIFIPHFLCVVSLSSSTVELVKNYSRITFRDKRSF